jgi:hypothetical protein
MSAMCLCRDPTAGRPSDLATTDRILPVQPGDMQFSGLGSPAYSTPLAPLKW